MGFRSILKQTFFGHPVYNFLYKIWIFCYLLNRICTQSLCQLQGIPIEMPNLIDRYGNKDWKLQSMHVNLFSRSCVFLLLFVPVFVFVLWPMLTRVLYVGWWWQDWTAGSCGNWPALGWNVRTDIHESSSSFSFFSSSSSLPPSSHLHLFFLLLVLVLLFTFIR